MCPESLYFIRPGKFKGWSIIFRLPEQNIVVTVTTSVENFLKCDESVNQSSWKFNNNNVHTNVHVQCSVQEKIQMTHAEMSG